MAALSYSIPAINDLKEIKNYIAEDSSLYATRFLNNIRAKIATLKKNPTIGRPILAERFSNLRQILFNAYRIVYLYDNEVVTIITVHHQSRLLENVPSIKDYKE
jgi:toxin ParE1/3/4